jgi:WD40 repeat protein
MAGPVRGLAIFSDGQAVIAVGQDVRSWELSSKRKNFSFQPSAANFYGCAISPDARRLAVGAGDGTITIWDLESNEEVATIKGHERAIDHLFFLADGKTLISIGLDQVRVWRAHSLTDTVGRARVRF